MLTSDDLSAQALLHKLVRVDLLDQDHNTIIQEHRKQRRAELEQHNKQLAEMAENATFRVKRLETVQTGTSPLPKTRDVEDISVRQADMDEFCKKNGIKKADLLDSIASKRGEVAGKNGARWIAVPNFYSSDSEQGNREAHELWTRETQAEDAYFASKKARGALQQPYPTGPAHSIFSRG